MTRVYRLDDGGRPRYAMELDGRFHWLEGDLFGEFRPGALVGSDAAPGRLPPGFRLASPVLPSKVVGIGLNYRDHAIETNKPIPSEPIVFVKPSTSVIGPGDPIRIPPGVGRVDYEAELGVVIGRRAWRVPKERAHEHVLGLTCVVDVTAREMQRRGIQWSHCKGYDSFAPLGPCIALGLAPAGLSIEGWLNGERRQGSNTRELIFTTDDLIAYISSIMTLLPGDVIATGTPSGIGPIRPGDRFTVRIDGIGELSNPVEAS
jgi:2-keto-4-pentenoate hydratase/2-oxohepta-3-ene-1,7-dioic acid hydratase in catechol pathway